jgi:membrane peptidoglycan carboxypeptidase
MRVLMTALLAAAIVPAAWGAARPQVRLMAASPATVAGTGFKAGERVVVSVSTDSTQLSKAIVVTEHGAFVAHFAKAVAASGCGRVAIVAVGSAGDRASWKSAPRSCGTPQQPITQ